MKKRSRAALPWASSRISLCSPMIRCKYPMTCWVPSLSARLSWVARFAMTRAAWPATDRPSVPSKKTCQLTRKVGDRMTRSKTRVSVIGLGNLGSALASALLHGGSDVTVWNRTAGRTGPLVDKGATAASTLRDALDHAEVVVFALPSYEVVDELL